MQVSQFGDIANWMIPVSFSLNNSAFLYYGAGAWSVHPLLNGMTNYILSDLSTDW